MDDFLLVLMLVLKALTSLPIQYVNMSAMLIASFMLLIKNGIRLRVENLYIMRTLSWVCFILGFVVIGKEDDIKRIGFCNIRRRPADPSGSGRDCKKQSHLFRFWLTQLSSGILIGVRRIRRFFFASRRFIIFFDVTLSLSRTRSSTLSIGDTIGIVKHNITKKIIVLYGTIQQ